MIKFTNINIVKKICFFLALTFIATTINFAQCERFDTGKYVIDENNIESEVFTEDTNLHLKSGNYFVSADITAMMNSVNIYHCASKKKELFKNQKTFHLRLLERSFLIRQFSTDI